MPESPRTMRRLISVKLIAFVVYALLLTFFVWVGSRIAAPNEIQEQGMWMITYVACLVIGGQAAIDALVPAISKIADAVIAWKSKP